MLTEPDKIRTVVIDAVNRVLGSDVGAVDDQTEIFQIGLDSLLLTEVLLDVEDALGAEVPIEVLDSLGEDADHLTIGGLVDLFTRSAAPTGPVASNGSSGRP